LDYGSQSCRVVVITNFHWFDVLCVFVEAIQKKQAERAEEQNAEADVKDDDGNPIDEINELPDASAVEDSSADINSTQNSVSYVPSPYG